MRTCEEIAKDLSLARKRRENLNYVNIAGASIEDLADLEVQIMKLDREIHQLTLERDLWIKQNGRSN